MRAQTGVERVAQDIGAPDLCKIRVGDLALRVNAGVGAPRAADRDGLAAERMKRGLDCFLHGEAIGLALPADERRAVIFDDELIAGHRRFSAAAAFRRARRAPRRKSAAAHRRLAGALKLGDPQRARAAGDGQRVVEDEARRSGALGEMGAQNLDALEALAEIGLEEGARKRRQGADQIMHLARGLAPSRCAPRPCRFSAHK